MQNFKTVLCLQSFLQWATTLKSIDLCLPTQVLSLSRGSQAPWLLLVVVDVLPRSRDTGTNFAKLPASSADGIL